MYDELINLLRRCGKQKCKNCEYEHVLGCVTKMNEKAADAIEELQKQRDEWESHAALAESFARGWIPVTERLPNDRRDVQITVFWHDAWRTMYGYYDGVFWHLYAPMHTEVADVEVIGWMEKPGPMPLPQPPKEE